jgi:hypothetical protein
MATFHNLRPFLKCEFANVPRSKLNLFTKDWPIEKTKSLATNEKSKDGESLPQILDARLAVEEQSFTDLVSALQTEASPKPEHSLSFAELREGMEIRVERAFYNEARSHPAC